MKTTEERLAALEQAVLLLQRQGLHFACMNTALMKMLVATAARVSPLDAETLRSRILEQAALEQQVLLEQAEDIDPGGAALLDDRDIGDVATGEPDA